MNRDSPSQPKWRKAKLKDLVFFQRGFDITKAEQEEGEIPVISSSGTRSYHSKSKVNGPGVIIGRKGSLGTVHYANGPYWPHDTTLWSKDLRGNNPRFVYYFMHTLNLGHYDVGNSNPTLNRNHIHEIEIHIPPSDTQDAIAGILEAYDALIQNSKRRITLLERSVRVLYEEWFVHLRFPGYEHVKIEHGIPVGWESRRIENVCTTIGGGTPSTKKSQYWDGGTVTWVVPTDVTRNDCLALIDSEKKITEEGLRSSSARLLPPDTILMTSRASVGFFALMDKMSCTNQGFINVVPHKEWMRMYLLYNLMWRVEEIRARAGGTTYKEISKGRFRNMKIVMPAKQIAREFNDFAYEILQQVRVLKKQQLKLAEARDLLLPRLMYGEIAV